MKQASAFFFLLYSVILSTPVIAQNNVRPTKTTFSGQVTDAATGNPLAGASIFLPDLRRGTIAGENGTFTLNNINVGRYLVEVSFAGYASIVQSVDVVSAAAPMMFQLKASFLETEGVTVTGVSAATSVKRTPVPVNIVKREELLRGTATNLIDALTKTPGIAQIATGPAISKPIIRGLGYNRVVIVNDGIRQEGQQWGDEHGIEIDELNVNRAEVLKGPASLMYGSDALAGVINFISIVPAPAESITGNLLMNYQSNNGQRAIHGDIGGNKNGFIWGLYGSAKAAGDYKNKYDGFVFNSRFNEANAGGYVGLHKAWGFSHLYVSSFNQRVGLVEGDRDSATGKFLHGVVTNGNVEAMIVPQEKSRSSAPEIPNQKINHFKIASDNSFNVGSGRLTAALAFQRNQRKEFGDVLAPDENELYFDLRTINYNVQYHLRERNGWKTTLGVNGMEQQNLNKGPEALIPEYKLFDIGGFVYAQKRYDNLTLSGGARLDNRSLQTEQLAEAGDIKFVALDKHFSNVSASAGLSYEASNAVTLKLNIARGFRAPNIPELASNGAHEGTNRFEYGRQDLRSERSIQVDAGIEVASEHITLAANLFLNSVKNFIYYRKLNNTTGQDSLVVTDGEDFFAFEFSQSNARLFGGEVNFDIHPHPLDWLHIENTFSYVRGTLAQSQDGSKNLPFIPAPRLINEIKGDFNKNGSTLKNLYVSLELDNTFAQNNAFTGYNTETNTPGYTLLNLGFGSDVASKGKKLFSVYFSANNIADVAYQNHLSRLKYTDINNVTQRQGVFNMGRNFSLKLNIPLVFSASSTR